LQLLAKLSQLVSSRELLSELREATSSQQALDAITRFENELDDAHA
jgi:mannitol/fructose-specific phosphotransferase system IIA component (Ntr-type)